MCLKVGYLSEAAWVVTRFPVSVNSQKKLQNGNGLQMAIIAGSTLDEHELSRYSISVTKCVLPTMSQLRSIDLIDYEPIDDLHDLSFKITCWARDTGLLDKPDPQKVVARISDGLGKLSTGVSLGRPEHTKEAIGDIFIALNLLTLQLGISLPECGAKAWVALEAREYPPSAGITE